MSVTCGGSERRAPRARQRRAAWLVVALITVVPFPSGSRPLTHAMVASAPAPDKALASKLSHAVACLWMVLGIGGVLLAFATGAFAPVVAVLLAGVALEVCG